MQHHRKHAAQGVSSELSLPSCDISSEDEFQTSNVSPDNVFHHHFKQTFLGPLCTECKCKVANGNTLFDISRNCLKAHMTKKQMLPRQYIIV
jgi:hypothetical protein